MKVAKHAFVDGEPVNNPPLYVGGEICQGPGDLIAPATLREYFQNQNNDGFLRAYLIRAFTDTVSKTVEFKKDPNNLLEAGRKVKIFTRVDDAGETFRFHFDAAAIEKLVADGYIVPKPPKKPR